MSAPSHGANRGPDNSLVRALRVVRERWWIIAATSVLCVTVAVGLAVRKEKQYDSTAKLLFRNSSLEQVIFAGTLNPSSSDPSRDSFTNINLVSSNEVAVIAERRLKLNRSPETLIGQVTVAEESNADVATITARDPDPETAASIANAFADSFIAYRRAADQKKIRTSEDQIRKRLNELPIRGGNGERKQLLQTLQRITSIEALQTGGAEVVDRAVPSTTPAVPKPKRDGVLGLLFGLVLGVSLAFLLDLLDNRLKRPEDFEQAFDGDVLAAIPQGAFEAKSEADRQAAFEPYRILRGALDFRLLGDELKTLLVTGPSGQEGKTTVAINLARAFAVAGQRVVLVEADLRRPSFAKHFQAPPDAPGLAAVLSGRAELRNVLRQSGAAGLNDLYILPSGSLTANAPELLESRAMHEVLKSLAGFADLVVIDAPSLLPVADARILLDHPQVDASLLVGRAYKTTRQEAQRVRALVDQHGREPLGLVVCGVKSDADVAVYGKSNGSGRRSRVGPVTRVAREPAGSATA